MRYLMSPNAVLCFLPRFASSKMVFSTQTSHPLTSLQEEDKLLRNVHLAEFSTNHLHKGTKA